MQPLVLSKHVTASLALVFTLLCGKSAQAQNVPNTAYYGGAPSNIVFSVPVIATVGGRCGFATGGAPSGNYPIPGSIDNTTWSNQFPFTLECTGPFRIAVLSTNGGLKGPATSDPGYSALAPYNVSLSVVHAGGTATGACTAANLSPSAIALCSMRGTASPTVGLASSNPSYQLPGSYLQVDAGAYSGPGTLVAGNYADTLTVTVSPSS